MKKALLLGLLLVCFSTASQAGSVTITGGLISAGSGQYGVSVSSATSLTVPAGAEWAYICVETAAVRYRDDGTAPTTTVGIPINSGTCVSYYGPLGKVQFIAQSGSPTIDVSYYKTSE